MNHKPTLFNSGLRVVGFDPSLRNWGIAFAAGPYMAGWIMENINPNWLWVACGVIGGIAMLGYIILDRIHHSPVSMAVEPAAAD